MDENMILGDKQTDILGTETLPTKDMLTELFELQYNLTDRYIQKQFGGSLDQISKEPFMAQFGSSPGVREQLITYTCDMIAEEAFELKRNFNYKTWKQWRPVNEQAAKEELVDIWHFLLQISIEMGVTPEMLLDEFKRKNQVNHNRQNSGTY